MSATTDWIQATGILITLPTAFWAIINLFRKDKDTQRKITALTDLAESQRSMITVLQAQLTEVQKQSAIFYDHNEIVRLHYKNVQKYNEIDLEEKKLKIRLEHKPNIQLANANQSGCDVKTTLHNIGKKAMNVEFEVLSQYCCMINPLKPLDVWNVNQKVVVGCYTDQDGVRPKNYNFRLSISYFDEIDNQYKQTFEYGDMGTSKMSEPALINND